ncbi:MAG: ornithine carbamoyltransferase, partial [Spirochaetota bacterium]
MTIPKLSTKDLRTVTDLSADEIYALFELSREIKRMQHEGIRHTFLDGQVLAMIFEKSSTRTRVSFESGMYHLGGSALFLGKNDMQLGRGEPITDTARVLSRYVDGIMIRTFEHEKVEILARYADIPVINGLSDDYHPCQALADYFSIFERETDISRIKLAYIGDGNNMAHSLMLTGALLGSHVAVASPHGYMPKESVVRTVHEIAQKTGATVEITDSVTEAAAGA